MTYFMHDAIVKLSDECLRLKKALEAEKEDRQELSTTKVCITTKNFGVFELDHAEIIQILENKCEGLCRELSSYNALGDKIK